VALKRQEELIREEEAAGLAEIELKAKRSAAEKEKRIRKKQVWFIVDSSTMSSYSFIMYFILLTVLNSDIKHLLVSGLCHVSPLSCFDVLCRPS
jgi:hypothetical protein